MIQTVLLNNHDILISASELPLHAAITDLYVNAKRQYRSATSMSEIVFLKNVIDAFQTENYTINEEEHTIYLNIN